MFKNNFIAVVKSNGRILREFNNGEVKIPFGSEYSILLKNKDSRKAVVSVSIDGKSVTEGRIIINGGSDFELLGFLEGMNVRNRFRFIQKTDEIIRHRGDNADDGIITVEYWFEERVEVTRRYDDVYPIYHHPIHRYPYYWCDNNYLNTPNTSGNNFYLGSTSFVSNNVSDTMAYSCDINAVNSSPLPDEGITVKGSETNQGFNYGHTNQLENQSSVINIILKGYSGSGTKVTQIITTSQKVKCPTCGRMMKSSIKYCSNCGTYLM